MRVTLDSTKTYIFVETPDHVRIRAQVWQGATDEGTQCQALIISLKGKGNIGKSAIELERRNERDIPMEPGYFDFDHVLKIETGDGT